MDVTVGLAMLDEARIVLRLGLPIALVRPLVEEPQLPAEEPFAPVRPRFTAVLPAAMSGVHGEIIGVCFDQATELPRGETERMIRFFLQVSHIHLVRS